MESQITRLVDSLSFPDIDTRESMIIEAADRTFGWILREDAGRFEGDDVDGMRASLKGRNTEYHGRSSRRSISTFEDWLAHGTGVFWVSGKPGSGKSTLMKFVQNHTQTRKLLKAWAGAEPLIVASHYFWHSGSWMQKSHEGLLRTLLYQILEADTRKGYNLSKKLISDLPFMSDYQPLRWNRRELLLIFRKLCNANVKICIFLDGLDEYNPHHDHQKLTEDILELSKSENVKFCVSSRPWPTFEDAFRYHNMIKLEDLNEPDIRQFVWDTLEKAARKPDTCRAFRERSLEATNLVEKITRKSDGVFLWTHFVVYRLRDWLNAKKSLCELDGYVDSFPSELEDYFRDMIFRRISPTWNSKKSSFAATVLKLTLAAYEHPDDQGGFYCVRFFRSPLLFYWFLSKEEFRNDPRFGEKLPVAKMSLNQFKEKLNDTKTLLKQACGDLISLHKGVHNTDLSLRNLDDWPAYGQVYFFHRTVTDFLMSDDMQTLINENVPTHIGTDSFTAQLQLATSKIILPFPNEQWQRHGGVLNPHYKGKGKVFLDSPLLTASNTGDKPLVAECEAVAVSYIDRFSYPNQLGGRDLHIPCWLVADEAYLATSLISNHHYKFTQAKISAGLKLYVPELVSALSMLIKDTATRGGCSLACIDYEFVQLLLAHGLSSRDRCGPWQYDSRTIWHRFLGKWFSWALTYYPPRSQTDTSPIFTSPYILPHSTAEHAWKIAKLLLTDITDLDAEICLLNHECLPWPESVCHTARPSDIVRLLAPANCYDEIQTFLAARKISTEPLSELTINVTRLITASDDTKSANDSVISENFESSRKLMDYVDGGGGDGTRRTKTSSYKIQLENNRTSSSARLKDEPATTRIPKKESFSRVTQDFRALPCEKFDIEPRAFCLSGRRVRTY